VGGDGGWRRRETDGGGESAAVSHICSSGLLRSFPRLCCLFASSSQRHTQCLTRLTHARTLRLHVPACKVRSLGHASFLAAASCSRCCPSAVSFIVHVCALNISGTTLMSPTRRSRRVVSTPSHQPLEIHPRGTAPPRTGGVAAEER